MKKLALAAVLLALLTVSGQGGGKEEGIVTVQERLPQPHASAAVSGCCCRPLLPAPLSVQAAPTASSSARGECGNTGAGDPGKCSTRTCDGCISNLSAACGCQGRAAAAPCCCRPVQPALLSAQAALTASPSGRGCGDLDCHNHSKCTGVRQDCGSSKSCPPAHCISYTGPGLGLSWMPQPSSVADPRRLSSLTAATPTLPTPASAHPRRKPPCWEGCDYPDTCTDNGCECHRAKKCSGADSAPRRPPPPALSPPAAPAPPPTGTPPSPPAPPAADRTNRDGPPASSPEAVLDVERLIEQLGSNRFAKREAAAKSLEALGEPALDVLQQSVATSGDLEVRRRATQVIRAIQARLFGELRQVRRFTWMDTVQGIPAHIYHTAFSPDGHSYLAGGDVGPLRLWDVATGKQLREFTGHKGWTNGATFTPAGKHILSGGTDRALRLWDVSTGEQVRSFEGHTADIMSVAVSPDGRLALSGSYDQTLRLWDLATGKELRRLDGHAAWCRGSFSPDGKRVLSCSGDRTIRLWDVVTGKPVRVLAPFKDAVARPGFEVEVHAFFLPGGRRITGYAWSIDTALVIWDAESGREIRRLALGADHCRDLAISPDGRTFLSGHVDRTVRLRDLATGEEISRVQFIEQHLPRGMTFSPDGRHAASGSWRGFVYLFRLRASLPAVAPAATPAPEQKEDKKADEGEKRPPPPAREHEVAWRRAR